MNLNVLNDATLSEVKRKQSLESTTSSLKSKKGNTFRKECLSFSKLNQKKDKKNKNNNNIILKNNIILNKSRNVNNLPVCISQLTNTKNFYQLPTKFPLKEDKNNLLNNQYTKEISFDKEINSKKNFTLNNYSQRKKGNKSLKNFISRNLNFLVINDLLNPSLDKCNNINNFKNNIPSKSTINPDKDNSSLLFKLSPVRLKSNLKMLEISKSPKLNIKYKFRDIEKKYFLNTRNLNNISNSTTIDNNLSDINIILNKTNIKEKPNISSFDLYGNNNINSSKYNTIDLEKNKKIIKSPNIKFSFNKLHKKNKSNDILKLNKNLFISMNNSIFEDKKNKPQSSLIINNINIKNNKDKIYNFKSKKSNSNILNKLILKDKEFKNKSYENNNTQKKENKNKNKKQDKEKKEIKEEKKIKQNIEDKIEKIEKKNSNINEDSFINKKRNSIFEVLKQNYEKNIKNKNEKNNFEKNENNLNEKEKENDKDKDIIDNLNISKNDTDTNEEKNQNINKKMKESIRKSKDNSNKNKNINENIDKNVKIKNEDIRNKLVKTLSLKKNKIEIKKNQLYTKIDYYKDFKNKYSNINIDSNKSLIKKNTFLNELINNDESRTNYNKKLFNSKAGFLILNTKKFDVQINNKLRTVCINTDGNKIFNIKLKNLYKDKLKNEIKKYKEEILNYKYKFNKIFSGYFNGIYFPKYINKKIELDNFEDFKNKKIKLKRRSITLTPEDLKKIKLLERAKTIGSKKDYFPILKSKPFFLDEEEKWKNTKTNFMTIYRFILKENLLELNDEEYQKKYRKKGFSTKYIDNQRILSDKSVLNFGKNQGRCQSLLNRSGLIHFSPIIKMDKLKRSPSFIDLSSIRKNSMEIEKKEEKKSRNVNHYSLLSRKNFYTQNIHRSNKYLKDGNLLNIDEEDDNYKDDDSEDKKVTPFILQLNEKDYNMRNKGEYLIENCKTLVDIYIGLSFLILEGNEKFFITKVTELNDTIDINFPIFEGNTLLIISTREGNKNITKFLCQSGCELNIQNDKGNTALHYAIGNLFFDIVDILISFGASEDIINKSGLRPWECVDYNLD